MALLYQEDILRTIEELSPPEDLDDNLKYFVKSVMRYFRLSKEISYPYVFGLLENNDNKIVYYNLDSKITYNIHLCASAIVYNILIVENKVTCYILMLTTIPQYRKNGYATKILDEFANDMREKYIGKRVKIILSATDESFSFYEKNNFMLVEDDLIDHPILTKHEKYDKNKLYYIFERLM